MDVVICVERSTVLPGKISNTLFFVARVNVSRWPEDCLRGAGH